MKAKPQGRLEGSWLGGLLATRVAVVATNWVFQGMRYMGAYEVLVKLLIDVIAGSMIYVAIGLSEVWTRALVSGAIAHTVNWVFNGHLFVLLRYVAPVAKTQEQFSDYVAKLARWAERAESIDAVAIYGSYCRGELHEHSDLDVRMLARPGWRNGLCGALRAVQLRFCALFGAIPLDVYCYSSLRFVTSLRASEVPVAICDKSGRLQQAYARSGEGAAR